MSDMSVLHLMYLYQIACHGATLIATLQKVFRKCVRVCLWQVLLQRGTRLDLLQTVGRTLPAMLLQDRKVRNIKLLLPMKKQLLKISD